MSKPRTDVKPIRLLRREEFSLEKIFPFNNLSGEESDDAQIVNEAYKKLFEELIPGFNDKHVQFVLAEVLEIDRKESTSRLLVYSDLKDDERSNLIDEYKSIINSLKNVSPVLISESDAFYITSRIWCAETEGIESYGENKGEREWSFLQGEKIAKTDIGLDINFDIRSEEEKIEATFRLYVERLYSHYLKNYPFAYVLLVPIFLSSMSGRKESLQKLGAVFLHFTTTKRVEPVELRRIYARTLLFWHYYFTSEAIDRRQSQIRERDAQISLYKRIDPFLQEIREGLQNIQRPFLQLETELNPVRGLLLGGDNVKDFFVMNGLAIKLGDGLPEITPRHDWIDGDVEPYKLIVAGVLIKALHLEKDIHIDQDLWESVSNILCASKKLLFKELLNSIPDLCNSEPKAEQVKQAYLTIKSWFSNSYKQRGVAPGLPLDMLEFALRVWECNTIIEQGEPSPTHFWVASQTPVDTIDALGMIHEKYGIKEAAIRITKSRDPISRVPLSSCELRLSFSKSNKKAGNLRNLRNSLSEALKAGKEPRGDMTKFLWTISGQLKLNLNNTKFIGCEKEKESEISIDFMDTKGASNEMIINWKGKIDI